MGYVLLGNWDGVDKISHGFKWNRVCHQLEPPCRKLVEKNVQQEAFMSMCWEFLPLIQLSPSLAKFQACTSIRWFSLRTIPSPKPFSHPNSCLRLSPLCYAMVPMPCLIPFPKTATNCMSFLCSKLPVVSCHPLESGL